MIRILLFALLFATPAMADNFSNNQSGVSSCTIDIVGSSSTPITATANYSPITYNCSAGTYLPADAIECATCPVGSYCGGGQYAYNETTDQGIVVCNAGYYFNSNNECVACQANHYCVGDGTMQPCPEFTYNNIEDLYPMVTGYNVHSIRWAGLYSSVSYIPTDMTTIDRCLVELSFVAVDEGTIRDYRMFYSSATGGYDNRLARYWDVANPGYYLSDEYVPGYWRGIKPCTNSHPEHSHYSGPGTPDSIENNIVDANDCPWACDTGYSVNNNDATCDANTINIQWDDGNGGYTAGTCSYGGSITTPTTAPTKRGHVFTGWTFDLN